MTARRRTTKNAAGLHKAVWEDHLRPKLPPRRRPAARCALRDGVYRDEASTPLDGVDHLVVKPLNDGDVVVLAAPIRGAWSGRSTLF